MVRHIKHLLLTAIILASALSFAAAQGVDSATAFAGPAMVYAIDFGVKSNSFENASAGMKKAIDYCKNKTDVTLILPGGRIDLWPEGSTRQELYISNATEDDTLSKAKHIAMLFEGFKNLTIEGNNTLVVLHGKMVSCGLLNCDNISFRHVRFDCERPTMSELSIQAITPGSIQATIHPDSKYFIDDSGLINWYGEGWKSKSFHTILFDSSKNTMQYSSFEPFLKSRAVETGPFSIRFEGDFSKTNYQVGNILTVRDTYRDNVGMFISRSKNIRLEDVRMHYMHGLGIVSQFSQNISLIRVQVAPAEGSGRIIAAFADCFHFSGCRGSILIDSCYTSGSHDDPVNVHGTHLKIVSIGDDKKLRVRFMHHQTYGFEAFFAGDSIAFINTHTLLPRAYAVVKGARLINKREMELELKDDLPDKVKMGDCIENITWTPELTIRNSRFERTNTRGILITTRRKVLIENNSFFRTGMHAILIADDALSWFESGPVQDVTIRNNRFEECGYNSAPNNYVIEIAPENNELVPGQFVHKNIRIENNLFKVYDAPVVSAKSVDGLVFSNNTVERSYLVKGDSSKPSLKLMACKNVLLRNNVFPSGWEPTVSMESMSKKEVK